jgi:hypothetical protein
MLRVPPWAALSTTRTHTTGHHLGSVTWSSGQYLPTLPWVKLFFEEAKQVAIRISTFFFFFFFFFGNITYGHTM